MLEKITNRIYFMKHTVDTDRPALGLIIGDDCCMVIDAGNSPRHAKEFRKEIEAMQVPPVKYLVLTHFHWDHILGLCEWDAVTIAHEAIEGHIAKYRGTKYDDEALEQAKSKGIYDDFAISSIKTEFEDREHFTVGKVDIFYNDRMTIDLGGITCEVRHIVSPHTEDTSIIYVPEEKTMFLGDCVYARMIDGDYRYDDKKLFRMIDEIEQYEAEYYLISHEILYPKKEMKSFWQQFRSSYEVASTSYNLQEALTEYKKRYLVEPSDDIEFYIKTFGLRE